MPKQYAPIFSGRSLFQNTLLRHKALGLAPPVIVASLGHQSIVEQQVRDIGIEPAALVLEPVARNTTSAVAAGALVALRKDKSAILAVFPSDHGIARLEQFGDALRMASRAARAQPGWLVTFGIVPDLPHTGYGYVVRGAPIEGHDGLYRTEMFVEKPDLSLAQRYLAEGRSYWNSGMFVFAARDYLAELEQHAPAIAAAAHRAVTGGIERGIALTLDASAFAKSPNISIDYAIMEKSNRVAVVPADIGWTDVGAWDAVWADLPKDQDGNAAAGQGAVQFRDTQNTLVWSDTALVAALGVKDLAIVAAEGVILVTPRAAAQDVGKLAKELLAAQDPSIISTARSVETWGIRERVSGPSERRVGERMVVLARESVPLGVYGGSVLVVVKGGGLWGDYALQAGESRLIGRDMKFTAGDKGATILVLDSV